MGKAGRRTYDLADVSIVPSRRTRDAADVDLSWQIDAFTFDLPLIASPMDAVVSPTTAIELGRLGAAAPPPPGGGWPRGENPEPLLEEIAHLPDEKVRSRLAEIYDEPV